MSSFQYGGGGEYGGGGNKLYEEAAAILSAHNDEEDEERGVGGTGVYHEPYQQGYRVFLQRSNYQRNNNSCGRLCDYEDPATVYGGGGIAVTPNGGGKNQVRQKLISLQ